MISDCQSRVCRFGSSYHRGLRAGELALIPEDTRDKPVEQIMTSEPGDVPVTDSDPGSAQVKPRERIAVVGLSYPFRGGISHYSTLLVRALRRSYEVDFVTLIRQYPDFLFPGQTQFDFSSNALMEPNIRIIDTLNPLSWLRAARILNELQPKLIVFQWWHPYFAPCFGTVVRLLDKSLQSRVCFLCHNVMPHEANPLQSLLTRYAFAKASYFVVHSEQDRRQLQTLRPEGTIRKGCHPTYSEFGSDQLLDKPGAREVIGTPLERDTLLFFGLVRPYKGLKVLLEAISLVLKVRNCQLLVVGEFYDDKKQYLSLIEKLGIGENVTVVDRYIPNEEVATYFHAADAVVLPYVSATQSGIVQIAFGLGTPVITTDVGGLPEAVDHRKTGLVVPAQDPQRLAEAILEFYGNNLESAFRSRIALEAGRFAWEEEIAHLTEFVALAG